VLLLVDFDGGGGFVIRHGHGHDAWILDLASALTVDGQTEWVEDGQTQDLSSTWQLAGPQLAAAAQPQPQPQPQTTTTK